MLERQVWRVIDRDKVESFFCFFLFLFLRLCLVKCKMFSKCKIFSGVWWYFKKYFEKYFLVVGCVIENTIENTFSVTWCSHFLSSKQIYNIKPNQKIHQVRSNWEKKEEREAIGFNLEALEARSCDGGDWVMVGRSSCSGLLDMGREKKGRSVTWV